MRSHEGGLAGSDSAKGGDWSGTLQEEGGGQGKAGQGWAEPEPKFTHQHSETVPFPPAPNTTEA